MKPWFLLQVCVGCTILHLQSPVPPNLSAGKSCLVPILAGWSPAAFKSFRWRSNAPCSPVLFCLQFFKKPEHPTDLCWIMKLFYTPCLPETNPWVLLKFHGVWAICFPKKTGNKNTKHRRDSLSDFKISWGIKTRKTNNQNRCVWEEVFLHWNGGESFDQIPCPMACWTTLSFSQQTRWYLPLQNFLSRPITSHLHWSTGLITIISSNSRMLVTVSWHKTPKIWSRKVPHD